MRKNLIITFCLLFSYQLLIAQENNTIDTVRTNKKIVLVKTTMAESFKGYLISQDSISIKIETFSAGTISIPLDKVRSIEFISKASAQEEVGAESSENERGTDENEDEDDPRYLNESRYFLSTSAFSLKRGQTTLRNNPITLDYGVTDKLSVGVGTSLFAITTGAAFFQLNTKYSLRANDFIGFKFSGDVFIASDGAGMSNNYLLSTGITLGTPDAHLSIGIYGGRFEPLTDTEYFYSVSGNFRMFDQMALQAESFIYKDGGSFSNVSIYTLRIIGRNASVDLGILTNSEFFINSGFIGLPVIGINCDL